MAYVPPTTHVTLLATLRRDRLLPIPGEVLVQPNQRVEAADTVAHAFIAEEHRLLDVARALDVPKEAMAAFMLKRNGDPVKKGEPIAMRKTALGLGRKTVYAPVDGFLVVAGDGKALLASTSKAFELRAGLPGTVVSILKERGVVIETTGALLEGVWGNGKDDFGLMRVLGSGPTDALLSEQVDVSLRGTILAVGMVQDDNAFRRLAEMNIRGLIVGSMNSALISTVKKLDIPVLITDRFGGQGFSTPVYNLLVGNSGREAWVNAQNWNRYAGGRPEVIIPLPTPGQTPPAPVDGEALAVGKRVRVQRGPQMGQVGTVTALSEHPVQFSNGMRKLAAWVELEETPGQPTRIAFANLEILE
jgi:hypothetical protein